MRRDLYSLGLSGPPALVENQEQCLVTSILANLFKVISSTLMPAKVLFTDVEIGASIRVGN